MKQPKTKRLHIVEGADWKASIITLLDSRSPYRPWRYGFGEARKSDPVAIVLGTEPRSVMTSLGRIGVDGRLDRAVVDWRSAPGLVDLDSMVMLFDFGDSLRDVWHLRGQVARQFETAVNTAHDRGDFRMRYGHSSVSAARILLHSRGRCSGCGDLIDLAGDDAEDSVVIRTVDAPPREAPEVLIADERNSMSYLEVGIPDSCWRETLPVDWPGILCTSCCTRLDEDGVTSLVDFRFSQNPKCPRCGATKARKLQFGMPVSLEAYRDTPPWVTRRGCVVTGKKWSCAVCAYEW